MYQVVLCVIALNEIHRRSNGSMYKYNLNMWIRHAHKSHWSPGHLHDLGQVVNRAICQLQSTLPSVQIQIVSLTIGETGHIGTWGTMG